MNGRVMGAIAVRNVIGFGRDFPDHFARHGFRNVFEVSISFANGAPSLVR